MNARGRLFLAVPLVVVAAAWGDPPTPPADLAKIDATLELLHARGATLKAFTADVTMTDTNPVMGGASTRDGQAEYQVKADGEPRLHLLLKTQHFEKKPPTDDKKEYLLDDGWLTDRNYHDKNELHKQVGRPGRKMNLFDLGKGAPFPLPIGQDPAAVHKLFDVELVPPDKADPVGTTHLLLKPKPEAPLAKQYQLIDVWVDPARQMPVRVETLNKQGTQDRTVDFANLKVNPVLPDGTFVLPPVPGMVVNEEPLPPEPAVK